jgi:CHAD domain-containing protein
MAEGKWISNLGPGMPLGEAARIALEVRLGVVVEYLPLAQTRADEDAEYVHQLRVGTRRAVAALDIFAPCLPEKIYTRTRRRLRRLRRAAGDARDWDVFLISLRQDQKPRAQRKTAPAGKDFLTGYCLGQRAAAQARLEDTGTDVDCLKRLAVETTAAIRENSAAKVLVELARPMLSRLLKELNQAAAEDLNDYAKLHQVRIRGKRLRYAMEIFTDCFWPPFREKLYPAVEEMQEILGRANDSHVAAGRLKAMREKLHQALPAEWRRYRDEIDRLIRLHQRRVPQEKQRFLKWWKEWEGQNPEAEVEVLVKS